MKAKLRFAVVVLIVLSGNATAQETREFKEAILYARVGFDVSRSAVNFETGKTGSAARRPGHFDLSYGKMSVNYDSDWFTVNDPRSAIFDLGKKQWSDFKETPPIPRSKKPRKPQPLAGTTTMVIDVSADSKEISPYQQVVKAKPGHMYLMKVMRGQIKTYVMLRVQKLVSQENCVVSWATVSPPPAEPIEMRAGYFCGESAKAPGAGDCSACCLVR